MSVTVLTAANSRRLTTVMAVMDELTIESPQVAESLVDQASSAIERYCRVIFAQQRYREIRLPERQRLFQLQRWPLVEVDAVSLEGEAVTDYRIESAEAGLLYRRESWWPWAWRATAEWTMDYVAGYLLPEQTTPPEATGPTLPHDLQRAAIETAKVWWHERIPGERIASKTLGLTGDRVDYGLSATKMGIPVLARDLLAPWRRMVLA